MFLLVAATTKWAQRQAISSVFIRQQMCMPSSEGEETFIIFLENDILFQEGEQLWVRNVRFSGSHLPVFGLASSLQNDANCVSSLSKCRCINCSLEIRCGMSELKIKCPPHIDGVKSTIRISRVCSKIRTL